MGYKFGGENKRKHIIVKIIHQNCQILHMSAVKQCDVKFRHRKGTCEPYTFGRLGFLRLGTAFGHSKTNQINQTRWKYRNQKSTRKHVIKWKSKIFVSKISILETAFEIVSHNASHISSSARRFSNHSRALVTQFTSCDFTFGQLTVTTASSLRTNSILRLLKVVRCECRRQQLTFPSLTLVSESHDFVLIIVFCFFYLIFFIATI